MARVEVDKTDLHMLLVALKAEATGTEFRRDLRAGLKVAVEPAVQAARASILSMGVAGLTRAQPSLRTVVAAATKAQVRLGARKAGVSVAVKKTTMPRGFRNAPKRLNARKGWRHPVFGDRDVWVSQRGKPDWFDGPMRAAKPAAVVAAQHAIDNIAERISARTRG